MTAAARDASRAAVDRQRTPARGGEPVDAGQTILLAEDDEGLRTLAMKVLAREGYAGARGARRPGGRGDLRARPGCRPPGAAGRRDAAHGRARRPGADAPSVAPSLPAILCSGYAWSLDGKPPQGAGVLRDPSEALAAARPAARGCARGSRSRGRMNTGARILYIEDDPGLSAPGQRDAWRRKATAWSSAPPAGRGWPLSTRPCTTW